MDLQRCDDKLVLKRCENCECHCSHPGAAQLRMHTEPLASSVTISRLLGGKHESPEDVVRNGLQQWLSTC